MSSSLCYARRPYYNYYKLTWFSEPRYIIVKK